MRMPVCRLCAAALLLAPSTCPASDIGGVGDHAHDAMRLPRIRVVVEVDILGSRSPSVRAELSRYPD